MIVYLYQKENLLNTYLLEVYKRLLEIYLLERLFVNDYNTVLSIDQERFIRKFLYEAGKVTDAMNNSKNETDALENLSPIMRQLDCFLGNYTGENDGQYTR